MPLLESTNGSGHDPGGDQEIELRVESVSELFRRFDPAPMSRRSLSGDVDDYLLDQVETLPPSGKVSMRIVLPAEESACCDAVQSAFQGHFAMSAQRHKDALRRHFKYGRRALSSAIVIAVLLALISQIVAEYSDVRVVQKIANGISIMVWVVLWRPLEFLFYDWRKMDREMKTYLRLSKSVVRCVSEPPSEGVSP